MKITLEKWQEGPKVILIAENEAEQFQLKAFDTQLIGEGVVSDTTRESYIYDKLQGLSFFAKKGLS